MRLPFNYQWPSSLLWKQWISSWWELHSSRHLQVPHLIRNDEQGSEEFKDFSERKSSDIRPESLWPTTYLDSPLKPFFSCAFQPLDAWSLPLLVHIKDNAVFRMLSCKDTVLTLSESPRQSDHLAFPLWCPVVTTRVPHFTGTSFLAAWLLE